MKMRKLEKNDVIYFILLRTQDVCLRVWKKDYWQYLSCHLWSVSLLLNMHLLQPSFGELGVNREAFLLEMEQFSTVYVCFGFAVSRVLRASTNHNNYAVLSVNRENKNEINTLLFSRACYQLPVCVKS